MYRCGTKVSSRKEMVVTEEGRIEVPKKGKEVSAIFTEGENVLATSTLRAVTSGGPEPRRWKEEERPETS
jgi:hypothetical protein